MSRSLFLAFAVLLASIVGPPLAARLCAQDEKPPDPKQQPRIRVEIKEREVELVRRKENYIGVFTEPPSPPLAAQLSGVLPEGQGLLVTGVMPGSPAAKADIQKDDVLAKYDDQKLFNTQQLRQLIVGDKTGREVGLEIVRQAKPQTVKLLLGERAATPAGRFGPGQIIRIPGGGQRIVIPGVAPQVETPVDEKPQEGSERHAEFSGLRVIVTSEDGKEFQVHLYYTDVDGGAVVRKLNGNPQEISKQAADLPESVRKRIEGSLERITRAGKEEGARFRIQLQPKLEGKQQRLELRLQQPGTSENGVRVLELDLGDGGDVGVDVERLLESEPLKGELNQLPPEVRKRVESTLRKAKMPEPQVKVQRSQ